MRAPVHPCQARSRATLLRHSECMCGTAGYALAQGQGGSTAVLEFDTGLVLQDLHCALRDIVSSWIVSMSTTAVYCMSACLRFRGMLSRPLQVDMYATGMIVPSGPP